MPCFPTSVKTQLSGGSVQVHLYLLPLLLLLLLLLKQAEQPCEDTHDANDEKIIKRAK